MNTSIGTFSTNECGTFANDASLPPLPVPKLDETFELYLETTAPLQPSAQAAAATRAAVESFLASSSASELQDKLCKHARECDTLRTKWGAKERRSWLEKWWLEKAYLEYREPLLVNSNWWLVAHRPTDYENPLPISSPIRLPFSAKQTWRASNLIASLLYIYNIIEREELPCEYEYHSSGKTRIPLCMNQFKKVFGAARIPTPACDVSYTPFPVTSKHIVVLACNHIFVINNIPLMATLKTVSAWLALAQSFDFALRAITEVVAATPKSFSPLPVCALTASHRDLWAYARSIFCFSQDEQHALSIIDTALFVVSLDSDTANTGFTRRRTFKIKSRHDGSYIADSCNSLVSLLCRMAHGEKQCGLNRWMDKAMNLVVTPTADAGCCGEHSPQDALTPATILSEALKFESKLLLEKTPNFDIKISLEITEIKFEANDETLALTKAAIECNKRTVAKSDISLLVYTGYGANDIKSIIKTSPDSVMQLAMQLAVYRTHKTFFSTYETVSTRKFYHGRTEACRVLSKESCEFVLSMHKLFPDQNSAEKVDPYEAKKALNLLHRAADSHRKYLRRAGEGKGIDRHLLGLRILAAQSGEPTQNVFKDPVFAKSAEWRLSTSSLGGKFAHLAFSGTGFGAVHPEGYGINYFAAPAYMSFGIECKDSCKETCSGAMRLAIAHALDDIKLLAQAAASVSATLNSRAQL